MRELELLFGRTFPLSCVVDVRVYRARASGVTAIALGDEPTTLRLTLSDRTRLEARSRGRGPQQTAIEAITRALAESRAKAALHAIAAGHTFAFGAIGVRPDGILYEGKVTRWEKISGYAIREGVLLWDDENGDLAGEVGLAKIPFSDALCLVVRRRLPGRDYARMPPGHGPYGGAFAVTARTRTPGTFKYQLHVVAALFLMPLLLFVGMRIHHRAVMAMDSGPPPVTITAATIVIPSDSEPAVAPSATVSAPSITVPSAMPAPAMKPKRRARAR